MTCIRSRQTLNYGILVICRCWRHRVPTDDVRQRPRKPCHGFPYPSRRKLQSLNLASSSIWVFQLRKKNKPWKIVQSTSRGHEVRNPQQRRFPAEKKNIDERFATSYITRVYNIMVCCKSQNALEKSLGSSWWAFRLSPSTSWFLCTCVSHTYCQWHPLLQKFGIVSPSLM